MTTTVRPPSARPPRPATSRTGAEVTTDRITAATLSCIARFGLGKLTVDDVAREAGCSRATLYRIFPSKSTLVDTTVAGEVDRVVATVVAAGCAAPTFEDAVTDAIVAGARALRTHDALRFVAQHEPGTLHTHLSFAGGDRFYEAAARRLAPVFDRWCDDPIRAAEWVVRVGIVLVSSAHSPVDVADRAAVHEYVSAFVTPGLASNRIRRRR